MAEIHGVASWPGVAAVEGCTYTMSTGITPGVAILRCHPQAKPIPAFGALTLSDGNTAASARGLHGKIVLHDCRIAGKIEERGPDGVVWCLAIEDRRWRWRFGKISLAANQLDPRGKLIAWTIRSPTELAQLCLDAMGEAGEIDMPPGLAYADGAGINQYLESGFNFPPTGNNPPINWKEIPPAEALQELCDRFGRLVSYRVKTESVLVGPPGLGFDLPAGGVSIEQLSPETKPPAVPSAVGVVGGPTRYQVMLRLRAVGRDWDQSWRPINLLSYAPHGPPQPQIVTATVSGTQPGAIFQVFLGAPSGMDPTQGALFEYTAVAGDTDASVAAQLASLINAPAAPGTSASTYASGITAAASGPTVTITGPPGQAFQYLIRMSGGALPGTDITGALQQVSTPEGGVDWGLCPPPEFASVRGTPELSYDEARRLAKDTVFKYYRVCGIDISGKGPIQVPGYPGPVLRREQLILEDTQVDQITPQVLDPQTIDPTTGRPMTVSLYSGYSRDRKAQVFGSVSNERLHNYVWYPGAGGDLNTLIGRSWDAGTGEPNTGANQEVLVPFDIDPEWQLVVFSDYVLYQDAGRVREPDLVLLTAVQVRNAVSNAVEKFTQTLALDSGLAATPPLWATHEDVQFNVSAHYHCFTDANGKTRCKLTGASILEADPIARAQYYLLGAAAQFQVAAGATVKYSGLLRIDCDGVVRQVTWEIGEQGCTTTASAHGEHDTYVPPAAARRRAERLQAILQTPQVLSPEQIAALHRKE